jgi:hypothetical protein
VFLDPLIKLAANPASDRLIAAIGPTQSTRGECGVSHSLGLHGRSDACHAPTLYHDIVSRRFGGKDLAAYQTPDQTRKVVHFAIRLVLSRR